MLDFAKWDYDLYYSLMPGFDSAGECYATDQNSWNYSCTDLIWWPESDILRNSIEILTSTMTYSGGFTVSARSIPKKVKESKIGPRSEFFFRTKSNHSNIFPSIIL